MPLTGTRVLDFSRQGPGPFCTMMLGDFGADVLLIEPPPNARSGGVRVVEGELQERQRAHQALRRNKRSIVLDLRLEDGRRVVNRLAERADVVIEGFRPGVVERLGIDYATLSARNPGIVYASLSGYGQDGPYADLVGHDVNYLALTGALSMIGRPGGPPAIPQNILADFAAGGQAAVVGVLMGLLARSHTGRGQFIDVAMSDSVLYTLASASSGVLAGGEPPRAGEGLLAGGVPFIDVYRTKDDEFVSIASLERPFWEALCAVIGRTDFLDWQHDPKHRDEVRQHLTAWFLERTRDEWWSLLRSQEICFAPVLSLREALDDEHHRARGMVLQVDDPVAGRVEQVGIAPRLSSTPGKVRRAPPRPGEHSVEVLRELGFSAHEVQALLEKGVVPSLRAAAVQPVTPAHAQPGSPSHSEGSAGVSP